MQIGFWLLAPGFRLLIPDAGRRDKGTEIMIPLQRFASGVIAEIVRRQPASKERTNFAWQLAVGQPLARVTTVELTDGVLTVSAVDRRWIREIERSRDSVTKKMQHILGADDVKRIDTKG